MVEKIESTWQRDIPSMCRHCDGCRDISPLAYNAYHLEQRLQAAERENAFLRSEIQRAIERGSDRMREVLEDILLRRRRSA